MEFLKRFVFQQPFAVAVENLYRASRFTVMELVAILATVCAIFW